MLLQEQDTVFFGIDWNAPFGTEDDQAEAIEVPAILNPLTEGDYSELCELVNPMAHSDSYGLDQYRLTVDFVETKILQY